MVLSLHIVLFMFLHFIVDILLNFYFYFQLFDLNWRTIVSNFLVKDKIWKTGHSRKDITNGWWFQSLHKKFNLVLKLYKLYIFSPSMFFQFNLGTKVYFCYFLVPDLREKREIKVFNSYSREKNQCWHEFSPPK
jgi:hypothetical protein